MTVRLKLLPFCNMEQLAILHEDIYWHTAVVEALNRDYTQVLAPYTDDPSAFRSMLRDTGSIVSGSTALWFFLRMRTTWTPGDMDLITPYATFDTVLAYIMSLPGANPVFYKPDDYLLLPSYCKRQRIRTPGGYIDIVQSRTDSPFTVVSGYWSTHVMNALTADAFWSAYPSHTLNMKGIYNHTPKGGCYTSAVDKHIERGFRISSEPEFALNVDIAHTCDGYIGCPRRYRVWGDQFTLKVPFAHASVPVLMKSMAGTFTAGWHLGAPGCGGSKCLSGADYHGTCLQWVR